MTGPKHLWSGGWEDESTAHDPPPERAAPASERLRPAPGADQPEPGRPRRRVRRTAWIATGVVVVAAAAAIVLPNLRSASKPSRTTSQAPTATTIPRAPSTPRTPTIPRTQTAPTVPTPTVPTPTNPGPSLTAPSSAVPTPTAPAAKPINWLGMEIVTLAPDAAVVETVTLNSEGDRAGVEPGDVIQTVDGHPVRGTAGILSAVRDLHPGDAVQLQIARHSAMFETQLRMAAQPTSP